MFLSSSPPNSSSVENEVKKLQDYIKESISIVSQCTNSEEQLPESVPSQAPITVPQYQSRPKPQPEPQAVMRPILLGAQFTSLFFV